MGFKVFRDRLALLAFLVLIPGLWVANKWVQLPEGIIGGTLVVWTLIGNFYFRKKERGASPSP